MELTCKAVAKSVEEVLGVMFEYTVTGDLEPFEQVEVLDPAGLTVWSFVNRSPDPQPISMPFTHPDEGLQLRR